MSALRAEELAAPPAAGFFDGGLAAELLDEELAAGCGHGHDEFVIALEAFGWLFGHGSDEGIAGGGGDFRNYLVGRGEWGMDLGGDDFLDGRSFEGNMAGEGMIKGASEAVHVREEIFPFAFDFFGGDVIGSSPNGFFFGSGFHLAGESEIDEFGFAIGIEEDITRFDIAVED